MKHSARLLLNRGLSLLCILALTLASLPLSNLIIASAADGSTLVVPDYVVDFSSQDAVDSCYDKNNCSAELKDGALILSFTDTDNGSCFDPYLSLPLENGKYDCEQYPYLALLVKTNRPGATGQLRFRTPSTSSQYPCQSFTYEQTNDWQVVVIHLTNRKSILFYPDGMPLSGGYTNIRLDMFDNECPVGTECAIKAYALYKTAEDAATFIHYKTQAEQDKEDQDSLPGSVDYPSFWMGEAFKTPALHKRMRWYDGGYTNTEAAIDRLLRQGYGGFTSNVLMNQQYLQDDAEFQNLKNAFDHANSLGMNTWIYDEYQWPSGKAFGLVLKGHDEFEATGIEHKTVTGNGDTAAYTLSGREISVMTATLTDESGTRTVQADARGHVSAAATGKWTLDVYVLRYTHNGVEDPTNWETLRHVDLLNPAAVRRFLDVTHEQYKIKLGTTFQNVQGFFTDEPQLGNRAMLSYAVWTEGLDELFLKTYGYPIHIPSLFAGDTDYDRMIRMNYYELVATLFRSSYTEQISAWCEENGTLSSGHFLFEENMNDQIETYGGNFMQISGSMTVPGADVLWVDPEHLLEQNYLGNYMGLRYVSSSAKNAGKADAFLEYNPDAVDALPDDDPMTASLGGASIARLLGCNVFHVINPQHSYSSPQLQALNTYVGRLNTLLDEVTESSDIGVFYPISTVQALHNADSDHSSATGGKRMTEAYRLNNSYEKMCLNLLKNQFMYTILDDETIRAATVTADGRLVAGLGSYRVVILGYAQYISVEALEKLTTFCEAGGTVVLVGDTPTHGLRLEQEDAIAALMAKLEGQPALSRGTNSELPKLLATLAHRDLTITPINGAQDSLLMADYASADRDVTFLVNTSYADMTVRLAYTDGYTGSATLYHPATGYIEAVTLGEGKEITIPACVGVILMRSDDNTRDDTPFGGDSQPDTGTAPDGEGNHSTTVDEDPPVSGGCRSAFDAAGLIPAAAILAVLLRKKKED